MAHAFVPVRRNQALLLPADIREWLPADHFAWFVLDSVEQFDLDSFYDRYLTGAQGRAAYDPKMIVALLLYAYANGIRSSRDIERHLQEDVAFRVIAANQSIDHATICRFRRTFEDDLSELFVEVVGLCVAAGMVNTSVVAIDGTKIGANASLARNATDDQLRKLAAKVFAEAEAIDAEEDRLYGDRRGDEIPQHLVDQEARLEWLREQLAERKAPKRGGEKKINTTDPDSRVMKTPIGYVQSFNAQIAVSEDHIIVAADLTNDANDVAQLEPIIEQTQHNLDAAGADQAQSVVADAGYLSPSNVDLDIEAELIIAPTTKDKLDVAIETHGEISGKTHLQPWPRHDEARRQEIMEAYISKHITASEAATALAVPIRAIYNWSWFLRRFGHLRRLRGVRPPKEPSPKDIMLERFADPEARAIYKRRAEIVEPVIGQLKEQRRMRRFLHRGLAACRTELRMTAAAHNLRRKWTLQGLSLPAAY